MNPQQKILAANLALVLYYIMPNLSSFVLTLFLLLLRFRSECISKSHACWQSCECSINTSFNNYLEMPHSRRTKCFIKNC